MSSVSIASVACLLAAAGAQAQWADSFDTYADGSAIVGQGGWEMWGGGAAPHGMVTSAQSLSAPNSLEVIGGDDIVQQYDVNSGVWEYRASIFLPAEASAGLTYFILLNNYPATVNPDWSLSLTIDPDAGTVTSFDGSVLPFVAGEWGEFRVVINLEGDAQDIYYDGDLLVSKSWSGGVQEGGLVRLAAVDLYAPDSGYNTYWDGLSLAEVDPIGACCLFSGECLPDLEQADCEAQPGYYKYSGIGSTCAAVTCPEYVAGEGWHVDAPLEWNGNTMLQAAECAFPSNDELLVVEIPYDAPWTFSLCTGTLFDTYLAIGSEPCGIDVGDNDDACGVQSEITMDLEAGTYYVAVSSFYGDAGEYTLTIDAPCVASIAPAGDPEAEACGDDTNGGCNMATPAFEPIALGQMKTGTVWIDAAGTRDTDWYEFTNLDAVLRWGFVGNQRVGDVIDCGSDFDAYNVVISQAAAGADTVMEVSGESVIIFGMIAGDDGVPSTDCVTATVITPAFQTNPCEGDITVSGVIEAGSVACEPSNGDTDGDGDVDVSDLLNVVGNWGATGDPGSVLGDTNCDGVVDVSDLLDVTGNWS